MLASSEKPWKTSRRTQERRVAAILGLGIDRITCGRGLTVEDGDCIAVYVDAIEYLERVFRSTGACQPHVPVAEMFNL